VLAYFPVTLKVTTIENIKKQFIDSWHYFIANVSISLYTISNVFILGLFANNTIVGYFSAADKIRQAVQNLTSISGRTIFPYLSSEFKKSKETAITFLKKYTKIVGTFTLFISLILLLLADPIVKIVLGPSYTESILYC
jgi:PST family polysaccharide transporter